MSVKTSPKRGHQGSANVPRRKSRQLISMRAIAKFFGLANRNLHFAVAEILDQDVYDVVPAVYFGKSNAFVDLSTGMTVHCGRDQYLLPATVSQQGEDFVFTADNASARARIAKKNLINRFGTAVIL